MKSEDTFELVVTIHGIKAYRKAYRLMAREGKKDNKMYRIEPVMLSFALEKALKAVGLFYDKNKRINNKHNLIDIFEQLNERTQMHLILYTGCKPRHFWRMMNTNADAFVAWRYIEEPKDKIVYFVDQNIMLDLVDVCLALLYKVVIAEAKAISGENIRSRKVAEQVLIQSWPKGSTAPA